MALQGLERAGELVEDAEGDLLGLDVDAEPGDPAGGHRTRPAGGAPGRVVGEALRHRRVGVDLHGVVGGDVTELHRGGEAPRARLPRAQPVAAVEVGVTAREVVVVVDVGPPVGGRGEVVAPGRAVRRPAPAQRWAPARTACPDRRRRTRRSRRSRRRRRPGSRARTWPWPPAPSSAPPEGIGSRPESSSESADRSVRLGVEARRGPAARERPCSSLGPHPRLHGRERGGRRDRAVGARVAGAAGPSGPAQPLPPAPVAQVETIGTRDWACAGVPAGTSHCRVPSLLDLGGARFRHVRSHRQAVRQRDVASRTLVTHRVGRRPGAAGSSSEPKGRARPRPSASGSAAGTPLSCSRAR